MRKANTQYVLVGAFVAAMIAGTLTAVALLTGQVGARADYHTILDNVADIGFGTQVRYEGYPIGEVDRIVPFAEGGGMRFRVELSIDQQWRLPVDSLARIGSTSVLSAKTIDIESGRAAEMLAPGARIPSAQPQDMFAVMAEVAGTFGDLSRDGLMPLIDQVTALIENKGGAIADEAGLLIASLNDLAEQMNDRMPALAEQVAGVLTRLDASAESLQTVASPANAAAVGRMISNLDRTSAVFLQTSERLGDSMVRVQALVADLDGLIEENRETVDQSLKDLRYSLGSVARNIDSMVHNLDGASRNMNEFSRLIRQNPSLLLNGTAQEADGGGFY